ncbi:type II toxin-antitoxin system prevent-host-death family antitoxin [Patescibacteria group bacterium]|nr:type II toxin-antitoxin system prevent-host-death family antitoxin [Patescibacteria group bacterium]MBU1885815.1 type II toxin-antitoxin system prevent-host-death family antitoxin [Patescibacteria group bacterium]
MKSKNKKTQTMTATIARTQFFELINAAYYHGTQTVLTKNGKEMARIVPPVEKKVDWDEYMKRLENFKPFLTDKDVEDYKQIRAGFNKPRFPDW